MDNSIFASFNIPIKVVYLTFVTWLNLYIDLMSCSCISRYIALAAAAGALVAFSIVIPLNRKNTTLFSCYYYLKRLVTKSMILRLRPLSKEKCIEKANSLDTQKIRDDIAKTKDFEGAAGNITLDENGDAVKDAVIKIVKDGKFKYLTTVKP